MGGEVNEPVQPAAPAAERPPAFDNLLTSPAKPNLGGDAPGKLNAGPPDTAQDKLDRTASVSQVEAAALKGDPAALSYSIQEAFEKMGGDPTKFQRFGTALAEQLKHDGITVHPGKNGLSIHKDGSPDAVEYKVDGSLDPQTGKVNGDVKATAYDWTTKQDSNKTPEAVTKDLASPHKPGDKTGQIKDATELGKAFDDAYNSKDYTQYNKDMAASFADAYKNGGMEAVRALEKGANDASQAPGAGPLAMEVNGKLETFGAEALSKDAAALAAQMTPEQLNKAGIVNHPPYGFMHIISDAAPVVVDEKSLVKTN